ncbi:MAG: protein translocase subunit SecF [Spirochaetes bacterium]|nr:protein translocase subunit SecF [Spirochaetota bacterium]
MERTIDFLKYRYIAIGASLLFIIVLGIGTFMKGGFNYGIDFVGGHKIIAKFQDSQDVPVNEGVIRRALSDFGAKVQQIGDESKKTYIIITKLEEAASDNVQNDDKVPVSKIELLKKALNEKFPGVSIESEETVGPSIGDYLRKAAWKLSLMAIVLMSVYLAFRFEIKFAVGGMVALIHDIVMSIVFCGFMGIEIDIQVLAALLTLYGYSINDTIVIFDRIRETNQLESKITFTEIINKAITQTMTRTILTSLTTLFAILALFFFGGETLHDFSLVLIVGIIIGTYSSIFIASPVVYGWEKLVAKK